ncbi:thiamine diphosphokinase [Rhodohalobacter halophilus]|uniref:thiamine diphosphokinase n=1 Tax=Rhodohalobacter halophilus TaxID=1812810 RepID=UPI00083FA998|nr:thiamine diphosphokinase [Rhodohalobacter halophilus]
MNVVILCDGTPPKPEQLKKELKNSSLFIAADGGAFTADRMGVHPDVIIGDLDSYQKTGQEPGEVIHDPDQETNDLEKALAYAYKMEANHVTVFGATGKRLDHTLKNLSVLKQFHNQFESIIFKDRYSDLFLLPIHFETELPMKTTVSLFPLSGKVDGISTRGLKYSLTDGVLENGVQDGSSNETIENKIEIVHKKGDLLIFINHKTD